MGKIYRRKRHSCGLCKPNKMGWAPARTDRERMEEQQAQREVIDEQRRPRISNTNVEQDLGIQRDECHSTAS